MVVRRKVIQGNIPPITHAILIKQVRFITTWLTAIMHAEPRKGSKSDKSEEQTKEGPGHISWSKNIYKSSRSNGGTALLYPSLLDGKKQ
jgi:hypothetical protein